MALLYLNILLVSTIVGSLILTTSASNLCGGVENRYVCDASDPKVFHICLSGNKLKMECPGMLNFNAKIQICDWPRSGLCPYDGYSGLDKESEYDDDEDANDIYTTHSNTALQFKDTKTTYAPSLRRNPYVDYRNWYRVRPDNEQMTVKNDISHGALQPKPYKSRYTSLRSKRRRLRIGRPHIAALASSRRRNDMHGSRSGRIFSPFSPPVDAYSYHSDIGAHNINEPRIETASAVRSTEESRDSGQLSNKMHTNIVLNKDPSSFDVRRNSHSYVRAEDVKSQVRSLTNTVPSWVSRLLRSKEGKSQTRSQQTDNHSLSWKEESKSGLIPKTNHRTKVLGTVRISDSNSRQNLNHGKSLSVPLPRGLKSKDNNIAYMPQQSLHKSDISRSTESNKRQSYQNKRGIHSTNLNQRIYPYRPGEAPASSAFTNKFFVIQQKQGNKPSERINSYTRSVSKYSKKPGKCSSSWCKLPNCRCVGTDIPGNLPKQSVPMMVMLTFDDGVNHVNFDYYKTVFNGSIKNPNGCPMKGTFFISGDSTDYNMVRRLTKDDHEIASHTLSHRNPTTWWASASLPKWEQEVVGMKNRLAEKSGVPLDRIQGMRAPFLQIGGDRQYSMLHEHKFRYDSSMVTGNLYENSNSPIWPFTLDSPPDSQTCNLTPCPTRSYPGLWEVPLIRWYGSNHFACAMPDSCTIDYGFKGTLAFLEDNFNRHYTTNRAPLGIFIHASWFKRKDGNLEGLLHFLHSLSEREDVWLLTVSQVLDWVQSPKSINEVAEIPSWQC